MTDKRTPELCSLRVIVGILTGIAIGYCAHAYQTAKPKQFVSVTPKMVKTELVRLAPAE